MDIYELIRNPEAIRRECTRLRQECQTKVYKAATKLTRHQELGWSTANLETPQGIKTRYDTRVAELRVLLESPMASPLEVAVQDPTVAAIVVQSPPVEEKPTVSYSGGFASTYLVARRDALASQQAELETRRTELEALTGEVEKKQAQLHRMEEVYVRCQELDGLSDTQLAIRSSNERLKTKDSKTYSFLESLPGGLARTTTPAQYFGFSSEN